jgi:hypothetical protein
MVFLDGVVGEMLEEVFQVAIVVGFTGQTEIALPKEVEIELVINQYPYSEIEFSSIVEHWIGKIFLEDDHSFLLVRWGLNLETHLASLILHHSGSRFHLILLGVIGW